MIYLRFLVRRKVNKRNLENKIKLQERQMLG